MAGRGLSKVLHCSDRTFRTAARGLPTQRRAFASSAVCQKHGAAPMFTVTSSPELDSILSTFRTKIFLPAHLSKPHQDLIYGTRNKKALQTDPVTVNVAGEEFQLEHIDRMRDVPNTLTGLFQAIGLMKDKRDWDNLPRLLEGCKTAQRSIKLQHKARIVRRAGRAGRQDVILECARRVSNTGFALNDRELVRQVMWTIQYKAIVSDWDEKQTKKALSWAEMVVVMLEDPKHSRRRIVAGESDPRAAPEVIGVLLQLAAVRAARHLDGKDEEGKVAEYAERLMGAMDRKMAPEDFHTSPSRAIHASNIYLVAVLPVLHGMKVAEGVLGSASKSLDQLKSRIVELEGDVATRKELLLKETGDESSLLGLWTYNRLLGSELL